MLWSHLIQFGTRGVALFAQPGNENLTYLNPLACLQESRPASNILEHILNGFHFRNDVIELNHAGVGGMDMRVDETRNDELTAQVQHASRARLESEDVVIAAHSYNPSITNRDGLRDRELLVNSNDFSVMQNEIGRLGDQAGTDQQNARSPEKA